MSEHRVYVVGSINQDLLISTSSYPKLGETVHGHTVAYDAGGKGANQAVAAARLGATTRFVGCVGSDDSGIAMTENLRANDVDIAHVTTVDDVATGLAVVTRTDSGQNAIIVIAGANAELNPDRVAAGLTAVTAGDILVVQLEIPIPAVETALRIARQRGATAILNAAPAGAVADLLADVDILVVNEFEAATVAGLDRVDELDFAAVAGLLAERHSRAVIVTVGSDGAWLAAGGQLTKIDALPVAPVDSTGAGDAFVGALAALLAQGHPLEQSTRWAAAAGAHACLKVGAQAGAPTLDDLTAIFGLDFGR